MIIELCNFKDRNSENWIQFKNARQLSLYFTSGNYYKQLLEVVKTRQPWFRGYKLRYIENKKGQGRKPWPIS